ncbi:Oidioi.mRNA.OKI2018_I69.XSR.g15527.t1.cds [Oikopleura dioica]|uniref:Oidioi.mRNA.OKI2018_I69.XSR.g15527.t1.cds n=1 Tax=Oikopleura dioica TaxID=34765 RepID=A0ABN7SI95_OIKDI|nr:Oidioi.mRNA.OKI2018_I69.XSR.g15527.t1.cds [Oikopleura dioica]
MVNQDEQECEFSEDYRQMAAEINRMRASLNSMQKQAEEKRRGMTRERATTIEIAVWSCIVVALIGSLISKYFQ